MPQTSPGCAGCSRTDKLDRLYCRVYKDGDRSGKQRPYGWLCPDCGAIYVDDLPSSKRWVYLGKYGYMTKAEPQEVEAPQEISEPQEIHVAVKDSENVIWELRKALHHLNVISGRKRAKPHIERAIALLDGDSTLPELVCACRIQGKI